MPPIPNAASGRTSIWTEPLRLSADYGEVGWDALVANYGDAPVATYDER